ncbi:MAG: zinc ribbon domain-containing protein [Gemmatimonadaceae bacterium]
MTQANSTPPTPKFCNECGTRFNPDARFCHECGLPMHGGGGPRAATPSASALAPALRWGLPAIAVFALVALTVAGFDSREAETRQGPAGAMPLGARPMQAPDISSMSPEEQADRLFNRVMRLSSEGKADSAAFFGSMALGALEVLTPLDAHRRYDMGLVALVMGDAARAAAQADTILARHRDHLLGLSLAARVADARGDAPAAAALRRRLVAAEPTERARALPEYADHDADIRAAVELARPR